ncbi:DHA2 family efflux MFS transporter permease subunit [Burkholderia vietnamiensis]|jgi:EmrB/QacA subfamily drug resistance transporter|uniref:Drug resistance transporter, EmrB/QacA subfamily n=1 Tax=Burkholderia vietnamiensis (strain G4 / LMG 22486) TaxID=269482 RepID=A4JBZ2_BURVG|nr:DHA2 family efflux MFS transporter permease subunit [Burkholderia vietnamiensis]ABO53795.1 drug resistance transporter, EmrB/QacA subfamily [Burkholderia vietnamiensis G4]KVF32558.1 disulfide bond formation protein DsbA [Burkholderia vietnamiensis]KVF41983.1 disulfide bond formation protein DsbA [Burkholderia vietnamiensis]MBR8205461.1 DHA2 family efflux MFS transporter permease subunit [Burkholderia vietnamiensis]MCA8268017.1 DHA2 family efflux MFS transporter permease subunit [Burkholderi
MTHGIHGQQRWYALIVLCLGVLMIVLDSTIVNVALPSIGADLHFTGTALVWVVNAYLLTFGGCLLLGGRLGDLYGQRRMFLAGLVVFTLASLACGVAPSQTLLIAARAVQGFGGAVVSAVSLSLIMNLFTEPGERARAMGVYGFVCAGGGSLGVLLGGLLTSTLSWHWIFLVNLPIGIAVYAMCVALLPRVRVPADAARLDVAGALTVTASLMLAVYGIVGGNEAGWLSPQTVGLIGAALALLAAFIAIEARVAHPLMPLTLFAARNVALANVIGVLWAAAMFAWFFLSALYMQRVLGYGPLQVGLAFLPANLIMAAFSLGLSARIVMRCGIRGPIAAGLLIAACGLALFSRAPVDGGFVWHVLPGMTLLGIGAGVAFNPVLLAAMSDVEPADSGLASGIVNTAFMMGGALGLAVLASLAAARTEALAAARAASLDALNGGYHAAFAVGAAFAAAAGLLGLALRIRRQDAMPGVGPAVH